MPYSPGLSASQLSDAAYQPSLQSSPPPPDSMPYLPGLSASQLSDVLNTNLK